MVSLHLNFKYIRSSKMNMFKKSDLYFVLGFVIMAIVYYHDFLNAPPQNVHIWRQTDCLSLAKNYEEGASFFEPEMHLQYGDQFQSGKSAGEFPILYYMVGRFWKLFGFSYWSYRIFYLIILFFGTFALYRSLLLLLENEFWSISTSLLLFTSPVFAYYGVSFLTDVPSICFILIGLYFFLRYQLQDSQKWFWLAILFFSLAGLIKVSSLIIVIFLGFILVVETITKFKTLGERKLFRNLKLEWIGFGVALVSIFAWYYYASIYNAQHGFKYTFNAIHPLWAMEDNKGEEVIAGMKDFTSMVLFSRPMLWLLLFVGGFNLINFKGQTLFAYSANIVIAGGILFYVMLWFPLLGIHDYYYSAVVVILLSTLIPFLVWLKDKKEVFHDIKTKAVFAVFLLINFIYCAGIMSLKKFSTEGFYPLVGNHKTVELFRWFNWNHQTNTMRYDRMKPYLDELGITEDVKIIVMNDDSFNSTLWLANRKGWTGFVPITDELMQKYIDAGAEYLLIDREETYNLDFVPKYTQNQVGDFEGVKIFKLN